MTNKYATVWAAKWLVSMYCTAVHSTVLSHSHACCYYYRSWAAPSQYLLYCRQSVARNALDPREDSQNMSRLANVLICLAGLAIGLPTGSATHGTKAGATSTSMVSEGMNTNEANGAENTIVAAKWERPRKCFDPHPCGYACSKCGFDGCYGQDCDQQKCCYLNAAFPSLSDLVYCDFCQKCPSGQRPCPDFAGCCSTHPQPLGMHWDESGRAG